MRKQFLARVTRVFGSSLGVNIASSTSTALSASGRFLSETSGSVRFPAPETDQDTIILTRADALTVFAAADLAADDKRYRVQMCPECPDQSCPACRTHLRDAEAFDQIADRMLQATRTGPAAHHGRTAPARQSRPAAGKEPGQ